MANNWRTDTLANICDSIDYGLTESAKPLPVGPKFLRITDIVAGYIDWASVPYCKISDQDKEKYELHHNDIVIARTGATTGYSIYIKDPPDAVFASYLVRYKIKKEFDARFVSYFLKSPAYWEYLSGVLGDKSAQPNASASTIAQVKVSYPSLPEQHAIAGILGTLDDKIELNRRMSRTLESMARAVFRQWLVENEEVEGWKVGKLGDVAENIRRSANAEDIDPETHYIGLEHMPRGSIALADWGNASQLASNKFVFKEGEFLFGKLRPYFHKVGIAPIDGVCSTDILVIAPKSPEWYGFVLGHISGVELINYTNAASTGTKMPRTSWSDISNYEVAIPPINLAKEFSELFLPMAQQIRANIMQSRTLASLRNILLPKLFSGEVSINI